MARPDLSTPEGKADYQAELRAVAAPWRIGGIAVVVVAAICMVAADGMGRGLRDPAMFGSLALLALGWVIAGFGIFLRTRHHRRRMREPT